MGQYYKPTNIDNGQWLYSHDYDNGLKLMEHSYIGNKFIGSIMNLMVKGGEWFKTRIVWAGDYYGDEEGENDYYSQCSDSSKIRPTEFMDEKEQQKAILVNHTKKLYLKYSELSSDSNDWVINPLPLLTALGNGRGGGDYNGENSDKVGIWANDILSIQKTVPKSKGFKEFVVKFENDY